MSKLRLLLITGSAKGRKSTSNSFANAFGARATELGADIEIMHISEWKEDEEWVRTKGFPMLQQYDGMGLFFPLYFDAPPCPVLSFLFQVAEHAKSSVALRGKLLFAVSQCGFPEYRRCFPSIENCRLFGEEAGMQWLGGLAYGGGSLINGTPLDEFGRQGAKIKAALFLAAEAVIRKTALPDTAQRMLAINVPPLVLKPVTALLNFRTRKIAREKGCKDIARKVYAE